MDFNQSPYFDDFDETKQYQKVLFKPGVAVQTREMNQLQSILQSQVSKFGNHVFKDGSMVIPGNVQYNQKVSYVKIAATSIGGFDLDWLEGQVLSSINTGDGGVEATVIKAVAAEGSDPITLIVLYTGGRQDDYGNDEVTFTAGATLYVKDNVGYTVTAQGGEAITGRAAIASQQAGVYYLGGYFVTVPSSTVVVEKYVTSTAVINAKIGIAYTEEIITYEDDASLLDNAAGTSNIAAPGADRFKIATAFVKLGLDETLENFFELLRIEEGTVQQIINGSQYNILQEALAQRTFDESGNYVVNDFTFDVRESRANNRGTWAVNAEYLVNDYIQATGSTTRYFRCIQSGISGAGSEPSSFQTADETSSVLDGSVRWRYVDTPSSNLGYYDTGTSVATLGNSSNLVLTFGPGKAYIQGFEVNKLTNSKISISKSRDTRAENNRALAVAVGSYVYVDPDQTLGLPDVSTGPVVRFYDRVIGDTTVPIGYGNAVGTGRLMYMDGDTNSAYKVGLTDIVMNSGKYFERDVITMVQEDASSTNLSKSYQLTGLSRYVGADSGGSSWVQLSGGMQFVPNISAANDPTGYFAQWLAGDTLFFGQGGNRDYLWQSFGNSSTGALYNGSTGLTAYAYASSTMQIRGYQTAFTKELTVGDTITTETSANATSAWTVVRVVSDTSMIVTGSHAFTRYKSTGWSTVVQNGPLRGPTGLMMSGLTIAASTVLNNSVIYNIGSSTRGAFSSQLSIGSIVAFCDALGTPYSSGLQVNVGGSYGGAAYFKENFEYPPHNGYSYADASNTSMVNRVQQWRFQGPTGADATAGNLSSYMVIGWGTNGQGLTVVGGLCIHQGGLAATSGLVVLLRGTDHAAVPASYNATTSFANVSTSAYVRLQAGTAFGLGTGNSTRFQSELTDNQNIYLGTANQASATKIRRAITENRATVDYATTSLTAYTSLSLINATTSTQIGSNFGAWYTGTSATFATEVFDSFALGINAKRLSGLYQLLDGDGGTSTAAVHTAVMIVGDATAKFTQQLRQNDMVKIDNQRIFITKISSNSIAYGVSMDGAITGSTLTKPMLLITNGLNKAEDNTLLFKASDSLASAFDNTYNVYKTQQITGVQDQSTVTFALSGASGTQRAEQLASLNVTNFQVAEDTVGSLGTPLQVTDVNALAYPDITLTVDGTFASDRVRVVYPVIHGSADDTVLGGVRTKTLTFDASEEFLSSSVASKVSLPLANADIFRVNKILMATSFVSSWTTEVQATATDVTRNYNLDNGQRDMYYGLGQLNLVGGRSQAIGSIKVWYDYFEHGTGDFFSAASYNPLQVPYELTPVYKNRSLNDYFDFRTKQTVTGSLTGNAVPRLDSLFLTDITRYLGRKETILLDRNGGFTTVPSTPDVNPVDPAISPDNSTLEMYTIGLEPYTRGANFPSITRRKREYKRYTMADIAGIDRRLTSLEEVSSLNLLEVKTSSLQIRDNADPTLERYKTGFFVDSFTNLNSIDVTADVAISMDEQTGTLNPAITYDQIELVEKLNFAGAIVSALEEAPQIAARAIDNYRVTGDLLTLNYTTSTFLSQTLATTSISVSPFLASSFIGNLTMTPSSDVWTSTETATKKVGDSTYAENVAAYYAAIARYRASGDWRPYVIDVGTSNRYVEQNLGVTEAPFCRANTILIKATGLKPNTKFYPFFDDDFVGDYVQGAHKWTFDSVPTLAFNNSRADTTAWAKWRAKAESKWITSKVKTYAGRKAVTQTVTGPKWIISTEPGDYNGMAVPNPNRTATVTNFVDVWIDETLTERKKFDPSSLAFDLNLPAASRGDAYCKALAGGAAMYYYAYSAYRGSGVVVHQDGTTVYTVNNRGYMSRQFLKTRTKVNGLGTYNYGLGSGTFYIAVDQNEPKYLQNVTLNESQVFTTGNAGELYSDSKGVIVALFDLPNTDTLKYLSGEKKFVLSDSPVNDLENWESRAEATYVAKGRQLEITRNFVSTKTYTARPYDPIAQSFKIPDQFTEGLFITDVDFFFQAKPLSNNVPVMAEIRTCDASGRPSAEELVPGTSVTLYPGDVNIDAKGRVATKFTFAQPVHLMPNKDYAVVLRADNVQYRVYTASLGQADINTPSKTYSTQATLGSLFKSQDGTLWTEDQTSDLKFVMNRAVFTQSQAKARVVNHNLPSVQLMNNPLMFVHGSNKIRVKQINHGHSKGDPVRLSSEYWKGIYATDSSTTVNGVPISEIFGATLTVEDFVRNTDTPLSISGVDNITMDDYIIQVSTPANLGTDKTTGISAVMGGGADITASRSILYHAVTPAAKVLNFPATTLTMTAELMSGFSYDGTLPNNTGNVYGRTAQTMEINSTNFLSSPKIMLSQPVEYSRTAGGTVGGGTGAKIWKDSFVGEFTLTTTNDAVSPAIDLSTLVAQTLTHRIDQATRDNRLPTTLPAVGAAFVGDTLFVDYEPIAINETSISFNGIEESLSTPIGGLFNGVVPGMYITIDGSSIAGNNNTSTGILVTDVSDTGDVLYVSGNLTSIGAGDAISIYAIKDFVAETGLQAGTANSKYISKKVNLENPATSIKMLIDANIPSEADFDVYYKIGSATENFNTFVWTKFDNMPVYNKEDQREVFTEVQVDISDVDDAGNAKDFPEFTAFQIKLVMRTTNAARVPQFKNLRVIAHA